MNFKVIIGAIAVLIGIYYGADWLKLRHDLTQQLQDVPYIKTTVGHFFDFSMEKSKDAPKCNGDCKGVSRYLFTMKGEKSTLLLAADYNRITQRFGHRVYCNQSGKAILTDEGMSSVLVCR